MKIFHIPVCPFSQRVEILLAEKGLDDAVEFAVVDITKPRPKPLLELTGGSTSLPVLVDEQGRVLKESMVLVRFIEERFPERGVARVDPYERGLERLMMTREGAFGLAGYRYIMNRDRSRGEALRDALLAEYRWLDEFLRRHSPEGTFLFERFGLAEVVYTPLMVRFGFLQYYEDFAIPSSLARVKRWSEACLAHPHAQQVSHEEVVKLYYDYAVGYGNGAIPEGRQRSSFTFESDWRERPMPPRDKYDRIASDAELGLLGRAP